MSGEIADIYAISNSIEQPITELNRRANTIADILGSKPKNFSEFSEEQPSKAAQHLLYAAIGAVALGAIGIAIPPLGLSIGIGALAGGVFGGLISAIAENNRVTKEYDGYLTEFAAKARQQAQQMVPSVQQQPTLVNAPAQETGVKPFAQREDERRATAAVRQP
jgi:hypothetical protein